MASDQFIHYSIQELAGGVFALIAVPGGAAHSNSALVDLGGQTLVFDTGETVIAGRELQNIARHLTGRNATIVVNSHAHLDHWLGNQVFIPTARIYASPNTIKQMPSLVEEVMGELHDLKKIKTELKDEIRALKEKLKTEDDIEQQAAIKLNISSKAYELDSVDEQQCCPANTEVKGSLMIEGSQKNCELRVTEGHTTGDVFGILSEEKVLLMGDLGFLQCHPYMLSCDPQKWIAQLRKFESMSIELFVPGHGPVGNKADVANLRKYIQTLVSRVVNAVRNGKSEQDVLQTQLPEPFNSWKTGVARYERSVHHLFQLFQRAAGNPNTNK